MGVRSNKMIIEQENKGEESVGKEEIGALW